MANYFWDFVTKFSLPYTYKLAENLVDTQGPVGLPAVPPRGERRGEGLDSRHLASPPRGRCSFPVPSGGRRRGQANQVYSPAIKPIR
jgi:hypothetical protein